VIGTTIGIGSPWLFKHRHRLVADFSRGSMVLGRRRSVNKRRRAQVATKDGEYQCVTIRPCLEGCVAVTEQQGNRYLSNEAPELPLPGCDTGECSCRYQYHMDRRENEDRRFKLAQFNTAAARIGGVERRLVKKGERRKSTEKAEPRSYFNDY
jgi:hypothetical protein